MEIISSKFNLETDGLNHSSKTRNQNNLWTHSTDCGSTSSLFPCKDCIEEPDGHAGICQVSPTVASTNLYTRPE